MKTTILLMCLSWAVYGDVYLSLPHPERRPGGCYDDGVGHLNASEAKRLPTSCYSASCQADGTISYTGCGTVSVDDPKCQIVPVDLAKPHPDCCPTILCESHTD